MNNAKHYFQVLTQLRMWLIVSHLFTHFTDGFHIYKCSFKYENTEACDLSMASATQCTFNLRSSINIWWIFPISSGVPTPIGRPKFPRHSCLCDLIIKIQQASFLALKLMFRNPHSSIHTYPGLNWCFSKQKMMNTVKTRFRQKTHALNVPYHFVVSKLLRCLFLKYKKRDVLFNLTLPLLPFYKILSNNGVKVHYLNNWYVFNSLPSHNDDESLGSDNKALFILLLA